MSSTLKFDYLVVGGGIVGLAVANALFKRFPLASVALIEKETHPAAHQTGHNSGVIHSGIYYKPGSLKARFARAGNVSLKAFCDQHQIPYDVCGKVIVAMSREEISLLKGLYQRGLDNELSVSWLEPDAVREVEPAVSCLAGVRVPSTGIVDYKEVARKLQAVIESNGGKCFFSTEVQSLRSTTEGFVLETGKQQFLAKYLINCAGLFSDRLATKAGAPVDSRIVPFRGEYFELVPEKSHLVKGMIYPVPNPNFPFLGVHLTRSIDGSIHAGPNAVLAWKREGYTKQDIDLHDLFDMLSFPGFWRLAGKHYREGVAEMRRSWFKSYFVAALQRLVPEIQDKDLVPSAAGVRAQALQNDGALVDDFAIIASSNAIHVLNAPSPAATSSLEIGEEVVRRIPEHAV